MSQRLRLQPEAVGIGMTSQRVRDRLVERLRESGIADEATLNAIRVVPRHLFIDEALASRAYEDTALPIGHGQTISQPWVVARMTEAVLQSAPKKVLEVGTGSGYQAAVLAELAAEVHTIERHAALAERARAALGAAGYERVVVHVGDGTLGDPEHAPFGAIAVAAAAPDVPPSLYEQLEPNGRLVVPVGGRRGQELMLVVRSPEGPATRRSVACRFVPLVGAEGFESE